MDLIGEIVEHDVQEAVPPAPHTETHVRGFPELAPIHKKRGSRFSQMAKKDPKPVSEAEKIHRENMEKLKSLTSDEIAHERQELLEGLDPKLVQALLHRAEARAPSHESHAHAEGFDGWIGGGKGVELPPLDRDDVNRALGIKTVRFSEEAPTAANDAESATKSDLESGADTKNDSEDDQVAPEGYQLVDEDSTEPEPEMHFPKPRAPTEDPELDINDPDFLDQLHEKYYADLPRETSKLAWMTEPLPQQRVTTYEAISDMRFDFQGNLVELTDENAQKPVYLGLHHHSDSPQLPGYTLSELLHLTRSVVPTQRCLGIQMLGRILHKLGLHKYNILPVSADDGSLLASEAALVMDQFEAMMWDLIEQLRVVDSLTEASQAKNLSVQNYAIEALWLWKQGGGRPKPRTSDEDVIAAHLQQV